MTNKEELLSLSKRELIRRYLALESRIEELERLLKSFDNAHTPSSKKKKRNSKPRDPNKPRFPGKPKGSNGGGIEIPPPDEVVEHKLDACPISGLPVGLPVGYRKKTVIDFPDKPIRVIEHRIWQYISPLTGEIIEKEVTLPKGIYGPNIQSITVLLKNLTNSNAKIAQFFQELGAPSFSTAQVQYIADFYAEKLEPTRENYLEELRGQSYVHADETGMRKDGKNGYIWGVFTNTIAIFSAQMSRARKHIKTLLPKYIGVIVRDGYNAYDNYLTQRCWVHLLREFKEFAEQNAEIAVQYTRAKLLYENLKMLKEKPPDENAIARAKWQLQDITTCLKTIKQGHKLATLIQNGGDDWFTALYHPEVPLDNNHAERELRPIVLLRKVIGCYRNEKGQKWIDNVLSVLHTWKLQGKNLYQQLRIIPT
ncbi:MAG TPA: IS66 family transposase [Candidatus Hodarchaeales archaeon]|nr:IS66 family transposase [Candidatus Hodarchaeales archaeon]